MNQKVTKESAREIAVSVCTHFGAAMFGGLFFLGRFGKEMNATSICDGVQAGSDCVALAGELHFLQKTLAILGLAFVSVGAFIEWRWGDDAP